MSGKSQRLVIIVISGNSVEVVGRKKLNRRIYVMFKTRAAVFYRDLKRRVDLDPIKHVLRVF